MKLSREFLVGGFTLVALAILATVTIYLQQLDVFGRRATYYVLFKDVKRLEPGAPVNASGIQVGKVSGMEYWLEQDTRVRVTIQIDRTVRLFSNAVIKVNAAEVIGDTTVEIDAGHAGGGATQLPSGGTLRGVESTDLTQMVSDVSTDLRQTLKGASLILNDPQNQAAIKQIMTNLSAATGRLDETLNMVNREFRPLMDELTSTSQHLNEFLAQGSGFSTTITNELTETRKTLGTTAGDVSRSIESISHDFNSTSVRVQSTLDNVDNTLKENQQKLRDTMSQLESASRALNDILERTRQGEGTLGRLVTDSRPFEELRELISTLSQALTGRQNPTFPIQEFNNQPRPTPTPRPTPRPTPQASVR
jgi:phospholipid/cholesterol/gamma-HCH transport system substrate-binding protein